MTEGRKDDAEKPRFDLVPPRALTAVARVLTIGARKYSKRGDCTCGFARAAAASQSEREGCAERATRGGSEVATRITQIEPAPELQRGTQRIRRESLDTSESGLKKREQIRRYEGESSSEQFAASMVSAKSNTSNSSLVDVESAVPGSGFALITTTLPVVSVDACATDATSDSDTSNATADGSRKHSPTCGIHRTIDGGNNWRRVEGRRERYFAAAMRHLWAWWTGEERDAETGESHLAHAACCVLFLLDEAEMPR